MSEKKDITDADKLWEEIKNIRIDMFALPNQRVKNHVQRIGKNLPTLYLKLRSSSVIASLESCLDPSKYLIEMAEDYIIVKRAGLKPSLYDLLPEEVRKTLDKNKKNDNDDDDD